ncbi:MAG TPA: diguanylate cyclase, partial [Spirochaetota bacterium]|nr:diguanylate cyclase [Spirochaetota bacterium]
RGVDIPGRYGGEEFIVILPGTDSNGAKFVAEKIRKLSELEKVDSGRGEIVKFTVSIGVASYQEGIVTFEDLVKRSDEMLYRAKECGRNRVEAD